MKCVYNNFGTVLEVQYVGNISTISYCHGVSHLENMH